MSGEYRYDAALAAAQSILALIEESPHLALPEKLADATYTILAAIYRAEEDTRAEIAERIFSANGEPPPLPCSAFRNGVVPREPSRFRRIPPLTCPNPLPSSGREMSD